MRFHVLAIPHTVTCEAYSACAFTQKVLKFCRMMTRRGHEVFHYGHQRSEVECTEHITVTDDALLQKAYGTYDWHSGQFKHNTHDLAHVTFNVKAAQEIQKRKRPNDFLLLFWSIGHLGVARSHSDLIIVEPGIGSYNQLAAPFSVFESYAVMHHIYAKYNMTPRPSDAVVPNYFDPDDFIDTSSGPLEAQIDSFLQKHPATKSSNIVSLEAAMALPEGQYVLMMTRLIPTKGLQLAVDITRDAKMPLVIVGQGSLKDVISEPQDHVKHLGYAEPRERAVLLARCKCLLAPSLYAEPFGGVNVEAQMSGRPVVTTDWGAFAETVQHGVTGFRCRSREQFVWALNHVGDLDSSKIRKFAKANYGLTKVATMYEEYFSMLLQMRSPDVRKERLALRWLERTYV